MNREIYIMRTHAYSEKQAHTNFCNRLANKYNVHPSIVFNKFNGDLDNFKVEMEVEYTE